MSNVKNMYNTEASLKYFIAHFLPQQPYYL